VYIAYDADDPRDLEAISVRLLTGCDGCDGGGVFVPKALDVEFDIILFCV
jgi:hypothetical protein